MHLKLGIILSPNGTCLPRWSNFHRGKSKSPKCHLVTWKQKGKHDQNQHSLICLSEMEKYPAISTSSLCRAQKKPQKHSIFIFPSQIHLQVDPEGIPPSQDWQFFVQREMGKTMSIEMLSQEGKASLPEVWSCPIPTLLTALILKEHPAYFTFHLIIASKRYLYSLDNRINHWNNR